MLRSPLARAALAAALGLAAYLALWPVPIAPVAWEAPRAPALEGPWAPDARLAGVEWVARGEVLGPEAIALDAAGRVHSGTRDGRIVRLDPARGTVETLARTGGRPLGMAFDPAGLLYVCDAEKGLLALAPDGTLRTLATGHGGIPFRFTDDVDVGPDGTVYFTDASSRFGLHQYREDVLEHGGHGRLLAYHPATGRTELLLSGLQFANGVAVAGDGSFLLVTETGSYRVMRYWLAGPRRGTAEPFLENLPGLPDNVTWSPERRAFWIALFSPRVPALDLFSGWPRLRALVQRLPAAVQPQPARLAWAVAVGPDGRVLESLQDRSAGAFAPVTSVRERGGVLWLGSLQREAFGRIAAPPPR